MSWSLKIRGGDLDISGATMAAVSGSDKLIQDFRCWLLEHMGDDEANPWYGSLIDGGRLNGVEHQGIMGTDDWRFATTSVDAEIRRIADLYQKQQIRRSQDDRLTYGKATIDPNEVLLGIASINFFEVQDNLLVRVTILTGTNSQVPLNLSLGPVSSFS